MYLGPKKTTTSNFSQLPSVIYDSSRPAIVSRTEFKQPQLTQSIQKHTQAKVFPLIAEIKTGVEFQAPLPSRTPVINAAPASSPPDRFWQPSETFPPPESYTRIDVSERPTPRRCVFKSVSAREIY